MILEFVNKTNFQRGNVPETNPYKNNQFGQIATGTKYQLMQKVVFVVNIRKIEGHQALNDLSTT